MVCPFQTCNPHPDSKAETRTLTVQFRETDTSNKGLNEFHGFLSEVQDRLYVLCREDRALQAMHVKPKTTSSHFFTPTAYGGTPQGKVQNSNPYEKAIQKLNPILTPEEFGPILKPNGKVAMKFEPGPMDHFVSATNEPINERDIDFRQCTVKATAILQDVWLYNGKYFPRLFLDKAIVYNPN